MDNHLVYMEEMKEKGKSTDFLLSSEFQKW